MLRWIALSASLCFLIVGCAKSSPPLVMSAAAAAKGVVTLPDPPLTAGDVGLSRQAVQIAVPEGHKLLVLVTLKHLDKVEKQYYLQVVTPKGQDSVRLMTELFDPRRLSENAPERVRLTAHIDALGMPMGWFDAKDIFGTSTGSSGHDDLKVGETVDVMRMTLQGVAPVPDEPNTKRSYALRELTYQVRLERLSDKELQEGSGSTVTNLDPSKFPRP